DPIYDQFMNQFREIVRKYFQQAGDNDIELARLADSAENGYKMWAQFCLELEYEMDQARSEASNEAARVSPSRTALERMQQNQAILKPKLRAVEAMARQRWRQYTEPEYNKQFTDQPYHLEYTIMHQ